MEAALAGDPPFGEYTFLQALNISDLVPAAGNKPEKLMSGGPCAPNWAFGKRGGSLD